MMREEEKQERFRSHLLRWYAQEGRRLPWREHIAPYRTWVSEIMLQQTRVEAVIPYFERFITTFPSLRDLAEADDDLLHKMWEGLGYYSRVRNMKKCAQVCVERHDGELPHTRDALLELPGIGPYTAGAIASIASMSGYARWMAMCCVSFRGSSAAKRTSAPHRPKRRSSRA